MHHPDPTPLLHLLKKHLGAAAPYRDQNSIVDLNTALDHAYAPDDPDAAILAGIYLHTDTTAWASQTPRSDTELTDAITAIQITPERLQTVYGTHTPQILALAAAASTLYPELCERHSPSPVLNDTTRTAYDHALAVADRAGIYRLDYTRSVFDQARATVERAAYRSLAAAVSGSDRQAWWLHATATDSTGIASQAWWHHTTDTLRLATAALSTTGLINQDDHDTLTAPARSLFAPGIRDLFDPYGYNPPTWEQIATAT